MNFESLCKEIIQHIEEDCPQKISIDTPLLEEDLIDSFTMLEIIILLEELLSIEVQPEDLSSKHFTSVEATAKWALAIANSECEGF